MTGELRNLIERSLLRTPVEASWLELDRAWLRRPRANAAPELPAPVAPVSERKLSPIEEQEYVLIRKTLTEERGFIRRAAAKLGISHQSLLRRLNKWPELRAA